MTVEDHKTKARKKAHESLQECNADSLDASLSPEEQLDRLATCMEQKLAAAIAETEDEIKFQSSIRKQMGQSWAEYACNDKNVTTTSPVRNETWKFVHPTTKQTSKNEINVLFESDYSRIERTPDLLTVEECRALQEMATANPNKGKNGNNYLLPWKAREANKDAEMAITKVEAFVTSVTAMSATMYKSPIMEMRMVSVPNQPTGGQECTVEADGNTCSETPAPGAVIPRQTVKVRDPTVVASILLVCEAPKTGGQIYFPKTGTVLLPTDMVGSAVLMLHGSGGEREEDPFIDEYLICPIHEGKMVTLSDDMSK